MIHGAVDGCSRLVVFLRCSTNNRAATVLEAFKEATTNYGLPSRVRCDRGENTAIALFMLMHPLRGPERGSVIVGRSVHNQRIERMWRDVHQGVLRLYRELFYYFEAIQILDPNNDIHMFCLHYVFLQKINHHLEEWRNAWNSHPLSSEHNCTPMQMWTQGLLSLTGAQYLVGQELRNEHFQHLTEVQCYVIELR